MRLFEPIRCPFLRRRGRRPVGGGYFRMQRVHIKGSQGSWDAEITYEDGRKETLACLHAHFWKTTPQGPMYDDPWAGDVRKLSKFDKHVALIKEKGRVIMTTD